MTIEFCQLLKDRYETYVTLFEQTTEVIQKHNHSLQVAEIAKQISSFVIPSKSMQLIVETAALYHDIGRYEQLKKYNTFIDSKSEDHALLGVHEIKKNNLFDGLTEDEQQLIFKIIENHNKKSIDSSLSEIEATLCNIIRDADKIDILKFLSTYYQSTENLNTFWLDLPDSDTYNPEIIKSILSAKIATFEEMKSLNDFKLLKLSWVFDINFAISFVMIHQAKYLEKIYNSLSVKTQDTELVFSLTNGICEAYLH
jgi:putative nucleotidyltransferase with HDIG domain